MTFYLAVAVLQIALVILQCLLSIKVRRIQRDVRQTLQENHAVVDKIDAEMETLVEYRIFKEKYDAECDANALGVALSLWLLSASLAIYYKHEMPTLDILKGKTDAA